MSNVLSTWGSVLKVRRFECKDGETPNTTAIFEAWLASIYIPGKMLSFRTSRRRNTTLGKSHLSTPSIVGVDRDSPDSGTASLPNRVKTLASPPTLRTFQISELISQGVAKSAKIAMLCGFCCRRIGVTDMVDYYKYHPPCTITVRVPRETQNVT